MTVALEEAAVAYEVRTAHIPAEPLDLNRIVALPLTPARQPLPKLHPTPVAALLQRAYYRLITGGWCTGALIDTEGARCLYGAIHVEARGDQNLESAAMNLLLDTIGREFGNDVDSVPSFNDAFASGHVPTRMVDRAADLADARGL
ncbi:hypothetical protein ACFU5O_27870 [Streptomyces sp. NPDC057445]|uniref:DUF6197 family protein n=1 Tax=Streptomyces sp. NPDC057445 TaxID=3346136 RepID=UPI00367513E7